MQEGEEEVAEAAGLTEEAAEAGAPGAGGAKAEVAPQLYHQAQNGPLMRGRARGRPQIKGFALMGQLMGWQGSCSMAVIMMMKKISRPAGMLV